MILPKNWIELKFESAIEKVSILNEQKIKQKDYLSGGTYPIIDQGESFIGGYTNDSQKIINCKKPAIVFGDHTRCVKFLSFDFCAGADGIKVFNNIGHYNPKLFFYFVQVLAEKIPNKGYARHYQHLEKEFIPLLPFTEQHRIVAKIDTLFSELDSSVALLKTIKAQLAVYRQAVLEDAFSDLSETAQLMELTSLVTSGSRGWAKYYSDNGAKFIRIGNLTRDGINIDLENNQYVTLPQKVEGARSLLMRGDILISITADLGSIGFVETDLGEAYINQHIALVRFNNIAHSKFYAWFLRSDRGQKELLKNKRGAGKLGLGLDDIRNARVPIITYDSALKILQKIESRLSVCDKLEQTVDQTLALSASLRQSILKKAFEGRLVPQDPNDEPAEKLLERIKAEKAAVLAKQKQIRKRSRK
jgi:type I restriction enzyme S subunit